VSVIVIGVSLTNVREHDRHGGLGTALLDVPTVSVAPVMAVALNAGMAKSCEIICVLVAQQPQPQGI